MDSRHSGATPADLIFFKKKNLWRTSVLFMGPLITLFWSSVDICPGFESQSGQPYSLLSLVYSFFGGHESFFVGPLIPLFWTSGDVSSGFQIQNGSLACVLRHLCIMNSSESPVVRHLLTSRQPAWKASHFDPYTGTCMCFSYFVLD